MRRARPPRPYSRRLIPGTKLRAFKYRRSPARKIPHDERRSALHSAKIRESPGIAGAPFFPCMANARRVDFVSLSLSHSICLFFFLLLRSYLMQHDEREKIEIGCRSRGTSKNEILRGGDIFPSAIFVVLARPLALPPVLPPLPPPLLFPLAPFVRLFSCSDE